MASTFAGIVTAFCNALQWDTLSLIVSQFKERLFFGIHRDLIDLMRLPDLSHKRARALFDAGITTLVELAHSDILTVEKVLHNSISFDSGKQHENENSFEAQQRNLARNFFITGKAGITIAEAAKLLIEESRRFVAYDIGVGNIKWTQEAETKNINQQDVVMLHMSCEEEESKVELKRKTNTDLNETPPKLNKFDVIQTGVPKETRCKEQKEQEEPDDAESYSCLNKNGTPDKKQDLHKLGSHMKTGQRKLEKNHIREKTVHKKAFQREVTQQHMHENKSTNKVLKNRVLSKENNAKTINRSCSSMADTKNPADNNDFCHRNNENKIGNNSSSNSSPIRNGTFVKTQMKKIEKHVKPPISKTKAEVSDTNIKPKKETNNFKEPSPKSTTTYKTRYMLRKSAENNQKVTKSSTENSSPNEVSRKKLDTSPPSGHSTKVLNKTGAQDVQDLFADEESFELNSGFTAAFDEIEQLKSSTKTGKENILPATDEIPSSQDFTENLKDPTNNLPVATPRQASRLLRSYRTQRFPSPMTKNTNENKTSKAKNSDIPKSPTQPLIQSHSDLTNISVGAISSLYSMQMNASHILSCAKEDTLSTDFKSVQIVDICGDLTVFKSAFEELFSSKRFGFCLGVQRALTKQKPLIGANLLINQVMRKNDESPTMLFQIDDSTYLESIAFCITENIVYYMNMQQDQSEVKENMVSTELKIEKLQKIFNNTELTLIVFEARKQLKIIQKAIPSLSDIQVQLEDPKVANWLLQPDHKMSLKQLTQQYAPECSALVDLCGGGRGYNSHGIDATSAIVAKIRASIEACVIVHIIQGQFENLDRIGKGELRKFFSELEMPIQLSLYHMETIGFPASEMALRDLYQKMLDAMKKLETKIFALHGKRFNLGSASAVGRVLGLHRKPNGRVSTSRQVLEKIDEPIAQLIIAYRKLNATVTKNIQPLFLMVQNDRIFGHSDSFTATGRISMKEPNLQNVAKDFVIDYGNEKIKISCRKAFFPRDSSRCLVSADFCQLEMRILAHMAKDPHLLKIMSSEQDVFTAVAAGWNNIKESDVSEQLRNGTKQICYGIVYGMGMRALAEALKCNEEEAKQVSEQFHEAYPAIRIFTNKIIDFARRNGYVETIQGRRRYLENINSEESNLKSQAERQAVNSAIQGSAADIAKKAILRTEKSILKYRSKLGLTSNDVRFVLHLHDELIFEVPIAKAKKIAKVISLTMEACTKLDVPLKVKLKMGRNWSEMTEIKF